MIKRVSYNLFYGAKGTAGHALQLGLTPAAEDFWDSQ